MVDPSLILSLLLGAGASVLLLPGISDGLSALRCLARRRPAGGEPPDLSRPPRLLFLVLAHDEEAMLPACLDALLRQDYPPERRSILVIADNCADATADRAREAGVRVLERTNPDLRGKPQAIAWALTQTDVGATDGLVIIDADTEVSANFAGALAARAPLAGTVLQPFIDVQNPNENALTRMAAVHSMAAHGIAYRVKECVGLNVPLGVGMCIGREVIAAEAWSAFSIAEDWELYAIFTARGVRIRPVPEARICAQEARSLAQSAPQRHRWLAGKLSVLRRYAGRLLTSPHVAGWQRLDAIAELTVLGPAVHLGVAVSGAVAGVALGGSPAGLVVAVLFLASLARPIIYTTAAVLRAPAPGRAISAFLYLPVYTVWRLWIATRSILGSRPREWERTARHHAAGRSTRS